MKPPSPSSEHPRTALFLDLCDSTASQQPGAGLARDSVTRGDAYGNARRCFLVRARQVIGRFGGNSQPGPADDFCSGFSNPQDAVIAALSLQADLSVKPIFHAGRPMACRVGLHTEPIANDEAGYLSQAGNLSSRLAAAVPPGGVAATGAVRELARGLAGVRFESLGERSFKGIERPIEVFQVTCPGSVLTAIVTPVLARVRRLVRQRSQPQAGSVVAEVYRLTRRLGSGGMGELWEADDARGTREHSGRFVVKFLRPDLVKNRVWRDALTRWFREEAEHLEALQTPGVPTGIVPKLDSGTWDPTGFGTGLPFLVMPWIQGVRLDEALARREIAPKVRCFARLCEAVGRIHARQVLHLDLKPQNVLVVEKDGDLHPTVIDLGLAQPFRPSSPPPSDRFDQGTLPYMAPEQLSRGRGEVGPSTDVYALGVILFEVLTTRHPCELRGKRSEAARRRAILAGPRRSLKDLSPDLPRIASLDRLVMRALNPDPTRRFRTAHEFHTALNKWLEDAMRVQTRSPKSPKSAIQAKNVVINKGRIQIQNIHLS